MKTRSDFLVVPWQEDFLQGLLGQALRDTGGDISRASFIFPHSRPSRYLTLLIHKEPGLRLPLILPRMHTVSGLFSSFSGRIMARPAWNAGLLDRVGLLLACVREEAVPEPGGFSPFLTDARRFFPWGLRLASLFEECFSQLRRPGNFLHTEGQVSPFAQMLLERLGGIFARYENALAEREWTSPGYDAFVVSEHLRRNGRLPSGIVPGDPDHPIYIAGFHMLTGAENVLFRHLWEHGARVVIQADPALSDPVDRKKAHWSCQGLADWAESWRAAFEPVPARADAQGKPAPRIRYYAGFDLHSQLRELERELAALDGAAGNRDPDGADGQAVDASPRVGPGPIVRSGGAFPEQQPPLDGETRRDRAERAEEAAFALLRENSYPNRDHIADTAVILPDSGLLMPVLHHLPHVDINVSMGYPLTRSPLFRLVDTLARLQEKRKDRGYYWRDLVDLFRHPYIKMLRPESPEAPDTPDAPDAKDAKGVDDASLRRELHRLEQSLRQSGSRYLDPRELLTDEYQFRDHGDLPSGPVLELLERLFRATLTAFETPRSPRELAEALEGVCALMLDRGGHLWPRFPIDAECLYRLRQSLIPELARSELAEERFSRETLFAVLRGLMEAERVPFEATPLVGLQILGMLESRLLSFRRVIIMDAVEDSLPGAPTGDPLLPEALRPELGLPPLHRREQVSAYHFFRLAAGAAEVVLLWQEGGDAPGIQERKKKKSRFVEELLWREERTLGRLLAGQGKDGPLTVIPSSIAPIPKRPRGIEVTPPVRDLLRACIGNPVSASLLDSYLRCPVRFFYERAAGLAPAADVVEGDDPLAIGDMLHKALHDVYREHQGQSLPGGDVLYELLGGELGAALSGSPDAARLSRILPADSSAMLAEAVKKRLADYLRHQPPATPLALERTLNASFSFLGLTCNLTGKADRIDCRNVSTASDGQDKGIVIVDYKTGHVPVVHPALWRNTDLWRRMEVWRPVPGLSPPDPDKPDRLLAELAQAMESVQLPFYLLLFSMASAQGGIPELERETEALPALDARWVSLGDKGQEIPLFQRDLGRDERLEIIQRRIPELVHFLLRHILESPFLLPRAGQHCNWCSSAKLCMLSPAS